MDRLFLDTNVLLDVLEKRAPWFPEAAECLALVRKGHCVGGVSAITLSDIAYVQRAADTAKVYDVFASLLGFLEVATLDRAVVVTAIGRRVTDIEDGFQLEAALQWEATHLLTRNIKDFPAESRLQILSPADYLERRSK